MSCSAGLISSSPTILKFNFFASALILDTMEEAELLEVNIVPDFLSLSKRLDKSNPDDMEVMNSKAL